MNNKLIIVTENISTQKKKQKLIYVLQKIIILFNSIFLNSAITFYYLNFTSIQKTIFLPHFKITQSSKDPFPPHIWDECAPKTTHYKHCHSSLTKILLYWDNTSLGKLLLIFLHDSNQMETRISTFVDNKVQLVKTLQTSLSILITILQWCH